MNTINNAEINIKGNLTLPILSSPQHEGEVKEGISNLVYKTKSAFPINELKPNQIYDINSSILNKTYANETRHWDWHEKPIVTADGVVLKHWEDVLAAKANGLSAMDVIVVEGLEEGDLLRYLNFCLYFKKLSYRQRFILISELEKYLNTTVKGKAWSKSLKGGETGIDINSQLGLITGFHKESIKYYKRIGNRGLEYFDESQTLDVMYSEAVLASPKREIRKEVPQLSSAKLGLLKLDIGENTFDFEESEPVFKKNIITYKTKMDKAIITLTIKNPEQFFQN